MTSGEIKRMLVEERDYGYLDHGIGEVLETLNSIGGIRTTSSCLGRVTIVEGPVHWGREEDSRIVYKTHGEITVGDILRVLSRGFADLWLKATGPILHLRTPSSECASHILRIARPHGFKHSGIIAMTGDYVVELLSAAQLAAPLARSGRILVRLDTRSLEALVDAANQTVREGRKGLWGLVRDLSSSPGPCSNPREVLR